MQAILNLRSVLWIGFFAVILWAWWVMYMMAMQMQSMPMDGMSMGGASMESMAEGDMTKDNMAKENMSEGGMAMDGMMDMVNFGPLFIMWAIMMAAMMGPTFVFSLRAYEDLITSANGSRGGSLGLILGYLGAWIAFAALIALAQVLLVDSGIVNQMGRSISGWFSAALLIVAGAYQFTKIKDICLEHCRSPMVQFLKHWHPGFVGGIRMGLHHGAYCVVCCWGLMAIGFVGGMMSLLWMGGATLLMTLEKLPQIGAFITRPIGLGLIGWGIYVGLGAVA